MSKTITAVLFILVTSFARPAAAEQPCVGSSLTCTWTCNQDGEGTIQSYNVTCGVSDYCVDAETNDFIIGTCDEMSDVDVSDPFAQIERMEMYLEKSGLICEDPKKK
jgi:hypothetical protein